MDSPSPLTRGSRGFQILILAFTTAIVLTALVGVSTLAGAGSEAGMGGVPQDNLSTDGDAPPEKGQTDQNPSETDSNREDSSSGGDSTESARDSDSSSSSSGSASGGAGGGAGGSGSSIVSRISEAVFGLFNGGGESSPSSGASSGGEPTSDTPKNDDSTSEVTETRTEQSTSGGGESLAGTGVTNISPSESDWLSNISSDGGQVDSPELLSGKQPTQSLESTNTTPEQRQSSSDSVDSFHPESHFKTDSPDQQEGDNRSYWRTTAYESYNTTGVWSQLPSTGSETLPEAGEATGERENITLYENASVVPSSGDIQGVSIESGANPSDYEFVKQSDGTVTATDGNGNLKSVPDGTTLQTQSRSGGGNGGNTEYNTDGEPRQTNATENGLTKTPGNLNSDVGRTASEVTESAGAESNSEKAKAITDWVKQNNEYRPDATVSDGEQPTSEFLLDEQGGGTSDFATTTAMMMREEGVPARVATGYRSTNETGEQSQTVNAMDQHMWVEAQNESGAWERYDPTPDQKESIQSTVANGNTTASESGVAEEVISNWQQKNETATENTEDTYNDTIDKTETDSESNESQTYIVELEPEPKPGQTVTVGVYTEFLEPVSGATVLFNGDSVGKTGATGELDTSVPYVDTLNVTVAGGNVADTTGGGSTGTGASTGSRAHSSDEKNSGVALSTHNQTTTGPTNTEKVAVEDGSKIYDLPTDVTVDQDGAVLPGDSVTASTTIDGEATPGLEVTAGETRVGKTDATGNITFRIPQNATENETIPIVATRGDIRAEGIITISSLQMSVDGGLIALPGQSATVSLETVTTGERTPLANTDVTVIQQAETGEVTQRELTVDEDGKASITLLSANTIEFTGRTGPITTTTSVSGLYTNAAIIIGFCVLIVGLSIGGAAHRYGVDRLTAKIVTGFFTVVSIILTTCSTAWAAIQSAWDGLRRSIRKAYAYVSNSNPLRQLWKIITAPSILIHKLKKTLTRVYSTISSLPRSFGHISERLSGLTTAVENPSEGLPGPGPMGAKALIRKHWKQLISRAIGRETVKTKTTVEIESRIVSAGLPEQPVRQIRKSLQQIQYAKQSGDDEITSVETAVGEINDEDATEQLDPLSDS